MPTLKNRRAPKSQWDILNPVLAAGEIGYELDTRRFKIGDGLSRWNALEFFATVEGLDATYVREDEVGGRIAAAIASDGTVVAAAEQAVTEELGKAGVITKSDASNGFVLEHFDNDSGVAFSITDADGKRSWLEIGKDGKPSAHAVSILKSILGISEGAGVTFTSINEGYGVALSVVDTNDRRSWIEIGLDGLPTQHAVDLLTTALGIENVGAITESTPIEVGNYNIETRQNPNGTSRLISSDRDTGELTVLREGFILDPRPLDDVSLAYRYRGTTADPWESFFVPASGGDSNRMVSWYNWVCWGDSLTYSSGAQWQKEVERLLGLTVVARGVSGERAEAIAYRQGGLTAQITVVGGSIPASGTVEITVAGTPFRPNQYQSAGAHAGSIAGVHGEILPRASDTDPMLFQRSASGEAVSVPSAVPWVSDDAHTYRDWSNIIWAGRNSLTTDVSKTDPANSAAARSVAAMVANIKSRTKRFIIFPVTNGLNEGTGTDTYDRVRAHEDYLAATYPDNFLNIRRILIDDGLEMAGITPTAQDNADVLADTIPASLRSDYIHHTTAAYVKVIAPAVADFITSKGWKP
ncbi:tail fiber protein [Rhodococcus phage ReqiPoco6]|uniref:Tail fiber protein n=1 Tax=Rhodococcus phage ReqiPoco6 TaxID=691964 RepID=D4P7M1_9CAUD|nr:tail fiber protein [Rhodococcus phage ReqiPoco6]ADD81001.1 tail fiber protein [Rhodococcus phage ReqiPoco6]